MTGLTISIITVHLNDFDGLAATLDSLKPLLSDPRVHWVVVDGQSSPTGQAQGKLLEKVAGYADVFVSEPDAGIYDAMNKGTRHALGQYLLYLNAGDLLHPKFDLDAIADDLGGEQPAMIWGRYDEAGKSNKIANIAPRGPAWLWWGMPTSHQAILFRRDLLGGQSYDTSLGIAGDYDLVLNLYHTHKAVAQVQTPVCIADATGVSNTRLRTAFAEQMWVRTKHYGTSRAVNLAASAAKIVIGWVGRIGFLRRVWK